MLLTNQPNSLQKTGVCETGLSDCHKMVFPIFRSTSIRLPLKIIKYRNYEGFKENIFCHELDQTLLKGEIYKSEAPYSKLTEIFQEIIQKHLPLKSKQVRGNHAPFMNKELSKVIMNKSRLRNKYLKWPSRENFLAYKKVKKKCNTLTRKTKKRTKTKTSNTSPKIRTLQRARHSGIQSDLLLQIKVQHQMKA